MVTPPEQQRDKEAIDKEAIDKETNQPDNNNKAGSDNETGEKKAEKAGENENEAGEKAGELEAQGDVGPKHQAVTWRVPVERVVRAREAGQDRLLGEAQMMHGVEFELLVFPSGNGGAEPRKCGFFLNVTDRSVANLWSVRAAFQFTLFNRDESKHRVLTEESGRTFSHVHRDWGFWSGGVMPGMLEEENGFVFSDDEHFDGAPYIKASFALVRVPKIKSKMEMLNYDSRKETGLIGLENQGATCYLNSLLQSLYHLPAFRRVVYAMNVNPDEATAEKKTIPLAMQRLFYQLDTATDAVKTRELTKSFGWNSYEAFTQHDVQEMLRVLTDNLEEKMKTQGTAGNIQNLFRGELQNYIECINVECVSERLEHFYDLALNVKGCADLYESIDKFTEEEVLDGDNQYRAEGHGLQDAKRGIRLYSLPPVLHMQLKRFDYNPFTDQTAKVNTRHEFPPVLDLSRYLEHRGNDADRSQYVYDLYGVLVHAGDVGGGHYYAYIRPTQEPDWFRFDDDQITKATAEEAIEGNYGGPSPSLFGGRQKTVLRRNSAYMLVYVQRTFADDIMRPLTEDELPPMIADMMNRERMEKERAAEEKRLEQFFMRIGLITLDEMARIERALDMFPTHEPKNHIRVKKSTTLGEVKRQIAKIYELELDEFRLWPASRRHATRNTRITDCFLPEDYDRPVDDGLFETMYNADCGKYLLFVERINKDTVIHKSLVEKHTPESPMPAVTPAQPEESVVKDETTEIKDKAANDGEGGNQETGGEEEQGDENTVVVPPFNEPQSLYRYFQDRDTLFLLVKRFDRDDGIGRLTMCGFIAIDGNTTVGEALPALCKMVGYKDRPVWLYEEKHWESKVLGIVTSIRHYEDDTLFQRKLSSGDILVLQEAPEEEKETEENEEEADSHIIDVEKELQKMRSNNAYDFFKFLRNTIEIHLRPIETAGHNKDPLPPIILHVSNEWSLGQLMALLTREYPGYVKRWSEDSIVDVEKATKAAEATPDDDVTTNAGLRIAKERLTAAEKRSAAPLLDVNRLRCHEKTFHEIAKPLPFKDLSRSLSNLLEYRSKTSARTLYYEVLPMTLQELHNCKNVKVKHVELDGTVSESLNVFVQKEADVAEFLTVVESELKKRSEMEGRKEDSVEDKHEDAIASKEMLCFSVARSRLETELTPDLKVTGPDFPASSYDPVMVMNLTVADAKIRASGGDNVRRVRVVQIDTSGNIANVSGGEVVVFITNETTFGELRERLRNRLAVSKRDWNKWLFCIPPSPSSWLTAAALKMIARETVEEPEEDETLDATETETSKTEPTETTDPYAESDGMLVADVLGKDVNGNCSLGLVLPKGRVHKKRRQKYYRKQEAIKIYG